MAKKKNRQRIKYDIRSGTLTTRSKAKKKAISNPQPKLSPEEREYLKYERLARKAGVENIIIRRRYPTVIAGEKVRGFPHKPQDIVRKQVQEGLTDKEVASRFKASQKLTPNKFVDIEDFRNKKGWRDIEEEIANLTNANPNLSTTELSLLITRTIFSPPME